MVQAYLSIDEFKLVILGFFLCPFPLLLRLSELSLQSLYRSYVLWPRLSVLESEIEVLDEELAL